MACSFSTYELADFGEGGAGGVQIGASFVSRGNADCVVQRFLSLEQRGGEIGGYGDKAGVGQKIF